MASQPVPSDWTPPGELSDRPGILRRRWLDRRIPLFLGASVAIAYVVCATVAAVRFPTSFGPWRDNTLSQLGNPRLNPAGHTVYLVGCGIAGALAIAFFASIGRWRASGTDMQRWVLLVVQALGVVGGVGLFMNAVFPETSYSQHHFWAGLLFNAFAATSLVSIPALVRPGRPHRTLIAFNVAAFAAVIFMFVFASVHWVEWLPAAMFLALPYVLALMGRGLETACEASGARLPVG